MRMRVKRNLVRILAIVIPLGIVATFIGTGYLFGFLWSFQPPALGESTPPPTGAATATVAPTATLLPSWTSQPTTTPSWSTVTPWPTGVPTIAPTETPVPTQRPEPTVTPPPAPAKIPAAPSLPAYGEVASYRLNFRRGPGVQYQIEHVLWEGDRLEILGQAPDGIWVRVIAPNKSEGWVNSWYVTVTDGAIEALPVMESFSPG